MSERRTHVFYGWWVVLTAAIGLCLGYAPIFVYSFGVFLKSLIAHFHSSRTSISLAFTLANVMQSVGAPLAGRLVDRLGPRKVILPSTLVFGLVLISFECFSTSLWQLYVLFIILGFIGTGTAPVPYGIVVSRWFDQRRGLALGSHVGRRLKRRNRDAKCRATPDRGFRLARNLFHFGLCRPSRVPAGCRYFSQKFTSGNWNYARRSDAIEQQTGEAQRSRRAHVACRSAGRQLLAHGVRVFPGRDERSRLRDPPRADAY